MQRGRNLGLAGGFAALGTVFERDGVTTPERFRHGGPVNGWNIR